MIRVKKKQIDIRGSKYLWAFNAWINLDKNSSFTIDTLEYYNNTYTIMETRLSLRNHN